MSQYETEVANFEVKVFLPVIILAVLIFLILLSISFQPRSSVELFFAVSPFGLFYDLADPIALGSLRSLGTRIEYIDKSLPNDNVGYYDMDSFYCMDYFR